MTDSTIERIKTIIREADAWIDAGTAPVYQEQPLAADWGRVAKVGEECGEAIDAMIAMTGQNPRKGVCGKLDDLLGELADVAMTAVFAIQHFTKDEDQTAEIVMAAFEKAYSRIGLRPDATYEPVEGAA